MTQGALIFAHNNGHIDYESMAHWSADNIRRHLGIPVQVITDPVTDESNARWFGDYNANMPWHNQSRVTAYELSPWDRTLVLDADYVVASNQLKTVLDSYENFLCFRQAYDATGLNDFAGLDSFGDVAMPMWWATVMCFNKSTESKMIFDIMRMVRDNWPHYRKIYKINQTSYRNDHALSIALCLVNGHVLDMPSIPWSLTSILPEHKLQQLDSDHYRVDFVSTDNRARWIDLRSQDFHAMGKQQLGAIVASHS